MKIYLDAGHGLNTAGKRCLKSIDPKETREWVLNDRVCRKIAALLADFECEVFRTDDTTGKTDVALETRAARANAGKADIFISVHHNAGINGGSGGGTVVFHSNPSEERKDQAVQLYCYIVNENLLEGNRVTRIACEPFTVIKKANAPSFLIECGFMDSTTDTPKILTDGFAEDTARGVALFLIDELKLKKKKDKPAIPSMKSFTVEKTVFMYDRPCNECGDILQRVFKGEQVSGIVDNRNYLLTTWNNITGYVKITDGLTTVK